MRINLGIIEAGSSACAIIFVPPVSIITQALAPPSPAPFDWVWHCPSCASIWTPHPLSQGCEPNVLWRCLETLKPPTANHSPWKINWNKFYTLRFMVVNWGRIGLSLSLCRWVIWMRPVFTNMCAASNFFSLSCHNFKYLQITLEGNNNLG